MPTEFQCSMCGANFYTAASEAFLETPRKCESCGGRLEVLKDIRWVVEPEMPVCLVWDSESKSEKYTSCVKSVSDETLELAVPTQGDEWVWMQPGTDLYVQFSRREPSVQGRYGFKTEVLDCKEEPVPLLIAESPEHVRHIQERNSFRLALRIPVHYRILSTEEANGSEDTAVLQRTGSTVNLSSKGLLMTIANRDQEAITEQSLLKLAFTLQDIGVSVRARVVRTCELLLDSRKNPAIGVEFTDIHSKKQEQIISYIFQKQRKRLSKRATISRRNL